MNLPPASMIRSYLILSFALFAMGCSASSDLPKETDDVKAETEQVESSPRKREHKPITPAKSAEQLVENFKTAFASGNTDAIESMVHWEGLDDAKSKSLLLNWTLSTKIAGRAHVIESTLRALTEEDGRPGCSRKPEYVWEYTTRYNDDSGGTSTEALITNVEGVYYFYACTPPEEDE